MSAPTPIKVASVPDSGTCVGPTLWTVKHRSAAVYGLAAHLAQFLNWIASPGPVLFHIVVRKRCLNLLLTSAAALMANPENFGSRLAWARRELACRLDLGTSTTGRSAEIECGAGVNRTVRRVEVAAWPAPRADVGGRV